jgi:hypothetical protein
MARLLDVITNINVLSSIATRKASTQQAIERECTASIAIVDEAISRTETKSLATARTHRQRSP